MTKIHRIAVVDDHPLYRAGIVHTLRASGLFEIVAEGGTASDAIRIARDVSPEVLLLDIGMPGSGLEAAQQITKANPSVRLLVVTASEADETVAACLDAGVRGYLLKGTSGEELVRVARSVCEGEAYVAPQLAARILTRIRTNTAIAKPNVRGPLSDLSAREEAVLEHVARGQTNKEIARSLKLSEKTVKHYMTSLMQKLQVKSRLEAALFFRQRT